MEFRWALAAFLGVLAFGTLQGIVVAIVLSLIGLSSQAARPRIHVIGRKRGEDLLRPVSPDHPDDETFEGLLIVRPEGRILLRQRPAGRRPNPRTRCQEQTERPIDRLQPGLRYRVFGAANDDRWRTSLRGRGNSRYGSPASIRMCLTTSGGPASPTTLVRMACFPPPKPAFSDISLPPGPLPRMVDTRTARMHRKVEARSKKAKTEKSGRAIAYDIFGSA